MRNKIRDRSFMLPMRDWSRPEATHGPSGRYLSHEMAEEENS
ncbi:hypothetical protein OSH11_09590 [Kaistia dalseonensis]|uniref:Uncharacterized protein n=1 Tax=Kaistia dalseonensis TaxID=410840 RepID=A0ABU0H5G3_9HYPH|nr:hypothetical protein [Kaistia dalseonensis]MCX5494956.1 hypothetical protein [Kaistia dalseonensis]MDQ0437537.1 hypothetical protein [Kaistia dalseonensis]